MGTIMTTALVRDSDSFSAGEKAAKDALTRLKGKSPDLCIVFASIKYDLSEIIQGIRSAIGPDIQIQGCTSYGEFTESNVANKSVALALVSTDRYQFKVVAAKGVKDNTYGVFMELYDSIEDFIRKQGMTSIIMLIDGMAGRGEETVFAAYTTFDVDTNIVGGSAGNDFKSDYTFIAANDTVYSDGVSICAVKGGEPFITGVRHGYTPVSGPLIATRVKDNVLYEINNEPAWDIWKQETRQSAAEIGIDVDNLKTQDEVSHFLIRFELGLISEDRYKIRVPLIKNNDNSLALGATITEGSVFRIMSGSRESQILSAGEAAKIAKKEAEGRKIIGALVFDCSCRAIILGDDFKEAIQAIKNELGDIPILGFETLGEICMTPSNLTGFHNTTSVVVLIVD